jgi:hypothetical protein
VARPAGRAVGDEELFVGNAGAGGCSAQVVEHAAFEVDQGTDDVEGEGLELKE